MKTVFADTFHFLALLSPEDEHHERVKAYATTFRGAIVTTEWVLTEVANGLSGSPYRREAVRLIATLPHIPNVKVIESDPELFQRGTGLYADRPDKEWSLTDCISFIVMRDEKVTEALTRDHQYTFTTGGSARTVGASLLSTSETSLAAVNEVAFGDRISVVTASTASKSDPSLWWALALAGFVVLLVEWWWFQRRATV